jgi:ribosomal protein S12 methylthiotransferase accessory factor
MNKRLEFAFVHGTHRIVPPAETLARIRPLLAACGVTRCASVTHLDCLGVPVYCAIRPSGMVLQASNGKGMTVESAQTSALMEAIELFHAENPAPGTLRVATQYELEREGAAVITPPEIAGWAGGYFSPGFRLEWICGETPGDGGPVWAPASAAYFARSPAPLVTDTNGLASGNHPLEASLHALYELLERDAISSVSVDGKLQIRARCRTLDCASIPDPDLRQLVQHIEERATKVVLLWMPSRVSVHSFWSILLNRRPGASMSAFAIGAGCHRDPGVAAARAVTEAAQARLTLIHGAREDRTSKPVDTAQNVRSSAAYRFFDSLDASTSWDALPTFAGPPASADLRSTHDWLLGELQGAGQRVLRFDLSRPDIGIPVVKILAPGVGFNQKLF